MTTLLADLGGTRLKSSLLPAWDRVSAHVHGGQWLAALRQVVVEQRPDEIALCVPGVVVDGVVTALPGKLEGIVGADLGALLDLPVALLVNDAIAYGVGEAEHVAGRVLVVTLGTGVGVAVVEDGDALGRGPLGGGLLGGQLVLADGRTFEEQGCAAALLACTGAPDVGAAYDRLRRGDPAAAAGFAAYRVGLVRGLTALCLAHAPDALVVGGGAAQPGLLDGVQEAVVAGLWPGQSVQVREASLGDAAALAGLSALLRARVAA